MILFLRMTLLLCCCLCPVAFANDEPLGVFERLTQVEYLRDEQGLNLEDVRQKENSEWRSIDLQAANFGFDLSDHWFRAQVSPGTITDPSSLLEIGYPLLDHLSVYLYENDILKNTFHTGDYLIFEQRPVQYPNFLFPLELDQGNEYQLYIHVKTDSSVQLPLTLYSEGGFWKQQIFKNILSVAFYSVLLSMFFYNAILFLIVRDKSYLYYILYLLSFVFLMASIDGLAYQFLWPDSPGFHQFSIILFMCCVMITAPLFTCSVLRLRAHNPMLYRVMKGFSYLGWLCLLGGAMLSYSLMVKVISILAVLIALFMLAITVFVLYQRRSTEVFIFLLAWLALMVGYCSFTMQKLGWLPINMMTEHSIEVGAILEVLLLALSLAERINSERRLHLAAQDKILDMQVQANLELDYKVKERTAELELVNLKLKEATMTDALTGIGNRRLFDTRLSKELKLAAFSDRSISLYMIDIDHFKRLNDNHGHQAGDIVLQKVAETLNKVVRDSGDLACRYGGEEFCLLLVNVSADTALEIAERVRSSIESLRVHWGGEVLQVTCSIGLEQTGSESLAAESEILKAADESLYQAKAAGRNCIMYHDHTGSSVIHST